MELPSTFLWWLIIAGSVVMLLTMLRVIGQTSVALASGLIEDRRAAEAKLREENAAAEAAGWAAAREPLALNPDGSIEEPIVGVVETPGR